MSASSSIRSSVSLILQVLIIGLLLVLIFRKPEPAKADQPRQTDEIREEISMARYQFQDAANRLNRYLDRLARNERSGHVASNGVDAELQEDVPASPSELLEELAHVTTVLARWKHDPLQRESVEQERARLEDLLRRGGNDTIDAVSAFFPTIIDLVPESAGPTWMQTRLLTHVVGQIETDEAVEYARSVFEDPGVNSGVRLKAAEIAMKKYKEPVTERLIDLLVHPDANFNRPTQIVLYFKQNIEPRAIPALIQLAVDQKQDRGARRATLGTLGEYDDHRVIDALKEVASDPANVDLRGVAVNSLNKLLGKEILDFVNHLLDQLPSNDPLINLLRSIKELWEQE